MLSVKWWQDRLYPTPELREPALQFLPKLVDVVQGDYRVLDIGAGGGEKNVYNFRGQCAEMAGVDLDPRVENNPLLDRGIVADVTSIPVADGYFDVAFALSVLEHIEHPREFAAEVYRLLKPGGRFLAMTPNFFHYVALSASLTPTWFHKWYNAQRGRDEEDTFATFYRLNSRGALRRAFTAAGFRPVWIRSVEVQPNYLALTLPTFLLGALYERAVNATEWLSPFRVTLFCCFEKP